MEVNTSTPSLEKPLEKPATATVEAANDEANEDDTYMTGIPLITITASIMLAYFATEMDRTIVSTIVPKITSEFGSLDAVGWYGGTYLLTYSSCIPVFGQLYSKFQSNLRWLFLIWLLVFEVGSVICATARSSTVFILGRALAGLGGAGVIVGGMCIIGAVVPLRQRTLFYAIVNTMTGAAALVGPPVGGVFSDSHRLTWRWCFWLNLPIGALATIIFVFMYRPRPKPRADADGLSILQKLRSLDLLGALLVVSAVVSLLLALQWGASQYPWKSPRVWGMFIVFAVLLSSFVALQIVRGDRAVFPPRLLKNRNVALTTLLALLLPLGQYVHIYFLPLYFQASQNLSAKTSGQLLLAYLLSDTFAAIATGAIVAATGHVKSLLCCGVGLFAVGAGVLYVVCMHHSMPGWILGQLPSGCGMGAAASLFAVSLHAILPPEDHVTVNTLIVFIMTLGGVLGSNLGQVVFSNALSRYIKDNVPGVDPASVERAGGTGFRQVLDAKSIPLVQEAFAFAVGRALLVAIASGGVATLLSLCVKRISLKKRQG